MRPDATPREAAVSGRVRIVAARVAPPSPASAAKIDRQPNHAPR